MRQPGLLVGRLRGETGTVVMFITILALGSYLIYPMILIFILSFDVSKDVLVGPAQWGIRNWFEAWDNPLLFRSLGNSFMVWSLVAGISFPVGIAVSLVLARTRIPFSYGLEYMFWVAYMFPGLASTIGWMMLLDPDVGILNAALEGLHLVDKGPLTSSVFRASSGSV